MEAPGAQMAPSGMRSLEPVAPILLFLVANRMGGLRWAVAAATLSSLAVAVTRRRRNQRLGGLIAIVTGLMIARGIAGIITGSEDVYFGLGIAAKLAVGIALIGSILLGRPLANRVIPRALALPGEITSNAAWGHGMAVATGIGGLYYLISGSLDTALYRNSSVEGYVIVRFLANWPLSTLAVVACFYAIQHSLAQIAGAPALGDLLDARINTLTNPKLQLEVSDGACPDRPDNPGSTVALHEDP